MKWTKENEERLKELALAKTIPEIANELKLDEWVVRNKMSRLKLKPLGKEKTKDVTIETVRADISKRSQKSREAQQSKQIKLLSEELVRVEKERDAFLEVGGVETYTIKPSGKESEKSEATSITLASDWHIEEGVKSSQVNGLNKFDINIAKERAEKFFKVTAKLIKVHQKEYEINTHILALLGDFISGSIHDDLKEGNIIQPTEAIWEAQKLIASGIEYLLKNTDVNLIIPCSAGNHCVDEKTEILTDKGFKKAKHITKDDVVASFNKETGEISYDLVEAIEKFSATGAYKITGKHKNEVVTPKHNLVINGDFIPAEKFEEGRRNDFRHTGFINQKQLNLTDDELRLITWVVTDGTMVDNAKYVEGSNKKRIQFKLSKTRKIEELKELLTRMGIKFTFKPATMSSGNVLQPYYIRIYGDDARKIYSYFGEKKLFPENFTQLSKDQLIVVCETLSITDGRFHANSIEWSSVEKSNINTIQVACINNGIACKYDAYNKVGGFSTKRKRLYVAHIYINGFNLKKNQKIKSRFIDKELNFVGIQTKNGTIITRRNGIINFTGNSRITEKQRIQTEYGNSLEILMYRQMEKYFANEDRVKFIINDSYLTYVKVFDFMCRFHHGHSLRFSGGIGGLFIPAFKAISQWNKSKHADWDFFGHFHQLKDGGNFISNGSLIGFNSFAVRIKADYEKPKQAFIIIDRERGMDVVRKITL